MNLYAYVGNDPLNFTDPSGTDAYTLGFSARVPILGVGIFFGAFVSGTPFNVPTPQTTIENFDFGVYAKFAPRV